MCVPGPVPSPAPSAGWHGSHSSHVTPGSLLSYALQLDFLIQIFSQALKHLYFSYIFLLLLVHLPFLLENTAVVQFRGLLFLTT